MAKRLKVGIFGATGEVGKAVTRMLSELDFIDRIYLEIREHNRYVLPGILYDYKGKETRKKEIDGRVYESYVGEMVCPIDIGDEGYSRFKDCDAILIAAAAPDLKEWKQSGDYSVGSLENFIKERTEKKIERIKKKWDEFPSLSKEYTEYLSRHGFDSSQRLDDRVLECLMKKSMSDIKGIHDAFNIINELDKSKKINVGYRSVEQLPPNIPLMKDYAKILKDLKTRSFDGMVMVLTNVPDYCCNILCAEAPELTGQTLGMTYLDMMRLNDLIIPTLNKNLPDTIKIRLYSLGNHDVHMIPCYDQKMIDVKGNFKSGELMGAMQTIYTFMDKIKENSSLNDYETQLRDLLKILGPDTKKVASPLEHEIRAIKYLFKGIHYDQSEIFTNSIFHILNPKDNSGVFVTLPHIFERTRIIAQRYDEILNDATGARLEKCIKDHETMTEAFVNKGIIKGMPRLVPEEPANGREYVILRDMGLEGLMVAKKKVEIRPHQKITGQGINISDIATGKIVGTLPAEDVSHLYARDGNLVIMREWSRSRKEKLGIRGMESAIEVYNITQDRTSKMPQIEIKKLGDINLDMAFSHSVDILGGEIYVASREQQGCVFVFDGCKNGVKEPKEIYRTEGNRPIHSVAVYELQDFTSKGSSETGTFIFGSSDNCIYVRRKDGKDSKKFQKPYFNGADESIDGRIKVAGNYIFAGGLDKIHVWNLDDPKQYIALETFNGEFDVQETDGIIELALIDQKNNSVNVHGFSGIKGIEQLYSKKLDARPTSVRIIGGDMLVIKDGKPYHYKKEDSSEHVVCIETPKCDFNTIEFMVR